MTIRAVRLRTESPGDAKAQITKAWRIVYGRDPNENDVLRALAYLAEQAETVRASLAFSACLSRSAKA